MLVAILMESKADQACAQRIAETVESFGVKTELYCVSAYKVPELALDIVREFNRSQDQMVYITLSGGANALSGLVAANAVHPVIACPLFKDRADYLANIHSSLQPPADAPSLVSASPQNAALAALRILALGERKLQKRIAQGIQEMKEGF